MEGAAVLKVDMDWDPREGHGEAAAPFDIAVRDGRQTVSYQAREEA
jgi:hypothetical protein